MAYDGTGLHASPLHPATASPPPAALLYATPAAPLRPPVPGPEPRPWSTASLWVCGTRLTDPGVKLFARYHGGYVTAHICTPGQDLELGQGADAVAAEEAAAFATRAAAGLGGVAGPCEALQLQLLGLRGPGLVMLEAQVGC